MAIPSAYAQQAKQYKQQEIELASPEQILLMLFDGAIKFLVKAKRGMEQSDIETSSNNLIKAQNIILEFMNTLDFEIGGEVAKTLYSLYEYLHYRLVQANLKQDPAGIDEVLVHLRDLKKTWEEAITIAAREKTSVNMEAAISA